MKPQKILHILNIAFFSVTVLILSAVTLLFPKSDFSELENRYLTTAPRLTVSSWFTGYYSDRFSEYVGDHFALRPRWISLRTRLERLAGHDAVSDIYFSDGRFYEVMPPVDYTIVDRSISAINSFGDYLNGTLSVLIAPTSSQIYVDRLPNYAPEQEQRRMINYIYSALGENIQSIDVYDALYRSRDDYIYYRTDHHWTTYGAYIAYSTLIRRYGYDPVGLDRIDIDHASHGFLGSYYSKVISREAEPDTVDIYTSRGAEVSTVRITSADGTVAERESVYFRENLDKKDKYLTFLGENVPLIEIESDAGGGSILVIKDSYANCLVPFLTKHFSRVTVADLRYMMDLRDYADPAEFDRVLILYNASTFASDANLVKLLSFER